MAGKRELIDTGTDKRYVRRDKEGRFKESDDVGRSLRQDVKQRAKTVVKSGYGDKAIRSVSEKVVAMTKAEKAELLNRAVGKLDEAATIFESGRGTASLQTGD